MSKRNFWVSWYSDVPLDEFEYHGPWWISGMSADDADIICAAVVATDEETAKEVIRLCYDNPPARITWRFCNERPDDWAPFCDRFQRADWMKWPSPATKSQPI